MHKTVVIGSVIIDVYRLIDKMKNENNLDANIREILCNQPKSKCDIIEHILYTLECLQ